MTITNDNYDNNVEENENNDDNDYDYNDYNNVDYKYDDDNIKSSYPFLKINIL